jgi:hypothetical protein
VCSCFRTYVVTFRHIFDDVVLEEWLHLYKESGKLCRSILFCNTTFKSLLINFLKKSSIVLRTYITKKFLLQFHFPVMFPCFCLIKFLTFVMLVFHEINIKFTWASNESGSPVGQSCRKFTLLDLYNNCKF